MQLGGYKKPYEDAQRTISQKDDQITELQATISSLQQDIAGRDESHSTALAEKGEEIAALSHENEKYETDN